MNSSRLPLSLVVLLATTTTGVCAQSALDPYEHIKAPASKKATPATDDSVAASPTYVTMPIGDPAEGDAKKGKFGFIPKVKMPNMGGIGDKFKSASAAVADKTKDVGSGIANGAKASGGLMTKPFSKGGKTKVAKNEDWSKGSKSAGRSASIEGLYVQDAQKQIAAGDPRKHQVEKAKIAKKDNADDKGKDKKDDDKSLTQTALAPVKGAGAATKKLLAPLAKLKPKAGTPAERPPSGFLDGALAKQQEQGINDGQQKTAEKPAVAAKPEATGTPAELAEAAPAAKKSKYGIGMLTKIKAPSIPFMGKKDASKTKVAKRAQVLDPQADAAAPATSALDPTAQAAKPAAPSTTPVTTPIAPELTQAPADKGAAKPAGKSKMAGMKSAMSGSISAVGGGLSKMNPFKKKGIAEPPKPTTLTDANKPAL